MVKYMFCGAVLWNLGGSSWRLALFRAARATYRRRWRIDHGRLRVEVWNAIHEGGRLSVITSDAALDTIGGETGERAVRRGA
jgi:hypothetical protein